MIIVYIVVAAFVMVLLLSIPLFPFWKVWQRMKSHHPDIWKSAGPFEPQDMIRSPGLIDIFLQVVIKMEHDKALRERDPLIVKWAGVAMEVVRLLPRTTFSRIIGVIIFFGLVIQLTKLLTAF